MFVVTARKRTDRTAPGVPASVRPTVEIGRAGLGRPGIQGAQEQVDSARQLGCTLARRVLRSTAGFTPPAPPCFAPAAADAPGPAPPSAAPERPFRDVGSVRLRTIPEGAAADDCGCDATVLSLLAVVADLPRSSDERWWRWMMRQPSGPSPSLTLVRAPAS